MFKIENNIRKVGARKSNPHSLGQLHKKKRLLLLIFTSNDLCKLTRYVNDAMRTNSS